MRPTLAITSVRPGSQTTDGSSRAATSRTPRMGSRCARSAHWCRRSIRAGAVGSWPSLWWPGEISTTCSSESRAAAAGNCCTRQVVRVCGSKNATLLETCCPTRSDPTCWREWRGVGGGHARTVANRPSQRRMQAAATGSGGCRRSSRRLMVSRDIGGAQLYRPQDLCSGSPGGAPGPLGPPVALPALLSVTRRARLRVMSWDAPFKRGALRLTPLRHCRILN